MKVMTASMVVGTILLGAVLLVPMSLMAIEGVPADGSAGTNVDSTLDELQSDTQENQSGDQGEVSLDTQENQSGDQGEVSLDI